MQSGLVRISSAYRKSEFHLDVFQDAALRISLRHKRCNSLSILFSLLRHIKCFSSANQWILVKISWKYKIKKTKSVIKVFSLHQLKAVNELNESDDWPQLPFSFKFPYLRMSLLLSSYCITKCLRPCRRLGCGRLYPRHFCVQNWCSWKEDR